MMPGNHEPTTESMQLSRCSAKRVNSVAAGRFAQCALALAVCLVAGCGGARPSKYYQLSVPGDPAPAMDSNPIPVTLLIGRLTGPSFYRESPIVYSAGGEKMGTYQYERWAEPPTDMVADVMLRQFRSSGHYRGVYMLRSDIRADYVLHGRIYDFKEISGSALAARVTMELELRNLKTATTVWTHFYTHDEPATGKDTASVVAAMNKNVQQGIAEFSASLQQYFTTHPPVQTAP
jgi:ABC-type uncharacterized transport system auxiliary subunit